MKCPRLPPRRPLLIRLRKPPVKGPLVSVLPVRDPTVSVPPVRDLMVSVLPVRGLTVSVLPVRDPMAQDPTASVPAVHLPPHTRRRNESAPH